MAVSTFFVRGGEGGVFYSGMMICASLYLLLQGRKNLEDDMRGWEGRREEEGTGREGRGGRGHMNISTYSFGAWKVDWQRLPQTRDSSRELKKTKELTCNVILSFDTVDETLKGDDAIENFWVCLFCSTRCF